MKIKNTISKDLSKEIMHSVAKCERQKLYLLCAATMPTLIVLLCVTAYSTHSTIARFKHKNFLQASQNITSEENQNLATAKQFAINVFEETYKGTLGLGIGSVALALFLTHKTKLTQIPTRLRQTQKYLSN
ncbi:MAG: hypothetical protein NZM26_05100 [Patescibacteria group bacterium]|nr:hypothetical protein [Patescibacteria group bacterium]